MTFEHFGFLVFLLVVAIIGWFIIMNLIDRFIKVLNSDDALLPTAIYFLIAGALISRQI